MENNRKDPRRQLIGAVSKALGQQFERDINAAFDHYRHLGVASIEKTPEPFHMTGRENGGEETVGVSVGGPPRCGGLARGGDEVVTGHQGAVEVLPRGPAAEESGLLRGGVAGRDDRADHVGAGTGVPVGQPVDQFPQVRREDLHRADHPVER